jgi:hypothetical protein
MNKYQYFMSFVKENFNVSQSEIYFILFEIKNWWNVKMLKLWKWLKIKKKIILK